MAAGKEPPREEKAPKEPPPAPPLLGIDPGLERALCELYREAGLEPPNNEEVEKAFPGKEAACRRVGRALADRGVLTPLSPKVRAWGESCETAKTQIKKRFGTGLFTLAQARDVLGVSRKYTLLLLEYWDRVRITQKIGEGRRFL